MSKGEGRSVSRKVDQPVVLWGFLDFCDSINEGEEAECGWVSQTVSEA
jgi:hypothetical protein